ncbi:HEPN domain-containing protein [Filimonas effusa]|uniref:HEPN domain-containing protein n=1 Tax=Filimonas effusa TaxID=2508721 RepID=A0A4V1MA03_9BACT|nr:HEPN domain-containing protein [Filimonas effusa]RXK83474.1 HEPN domain-containing protein [Filimonas effusa]
MQTTLKHLPPIRQLPPVTSDESSVNAKVIGIESFSGIQETNYHKERLVSFLTHEMDVEKIYLLGTYPCFPEALGEEYDVLILIGEQEHRPIDRLENLVHSRSCDIAPVFASLFKITRINEMIAAGNSFFINACRHENLMYDADRINAASPPGYYNRGMSGFFRNIHVSYMGHAKQFLQGAVSYYRAEEYPLACFMLHQAVEQGLSALLVPLMQFEVRTHNLSRLMRLARRFSIDVYQTFPRHMKRDVQRFYLLQKAYTNSRYNNAFGVTESDTAILIEHSSLLLQKIKDAYEFITDGATPIAA